MKQTIIQPIIQTEVKHIKQPVILPVIQREIQDIKQPIIKPITQREVRTERQPIIEPEVVHQNKFIPQYKTERQEKRTSKPLYVPQVITEDK